MLFEYEVVRAVASWLESRGYEVHQALAESEKGDDIVATAPDRTFRLFVEAKGESSSKGSTSRYGRPFSANQVKSHVAVALYRAAQMLDNASDLPIRAAMAFPSNDDHRRVVSRIRGALTTLGVEVFWVSHDGAVCLEGSGADFSRAEPDCSVRKPPSTSRTPGSLTRTDQSSRD